MKNAKISPVAVGLAGVLFWLFQAGWYTLFSRQWLAGVGKTMAELWEETHITLLDRPRQRCSVGLCSSLGDRSNRRADR
jgi:hypothetical protein